MRKILPVLLGVTVVILLNAAPAQAQATRTWVSGVGDDVNPCSRTAPCKTFAGAISKTAASGIINCIDPGGFGAVTITKSITIDCGNVMAGVLNNVSGGIIVNAGVSDIVRLRGLDIEGVGGGTIGVRHIAGAALHIENCRIFGWRGGTALGIQFTVANGASSELYVSDTTITDSGTGAATGGGVLINAAAGNGSVKAVFNRVEVKNNVSGIVANGTGTSGIIRVTLRDSIVSGNTTDGASAITPVGGGVTSLFIDQSAITHNIGNGVVSNGANALALVHGSTATANGTGILATNGGQLLSYQTNHVNDNVTANGTFTGTITQQ